MGIINAIKVKKQTQVGKKKRGYANELNIISIKNCLVDSFNSLNHPIKNWLKHSIHLAAMQSFPIQKKR